MRNVVLATIDSLREDIYQDGDVMPTLSGLSEDGLKFENAIAPGPRTPSSIPPTMTGEFYRTELEGVTGRRQGINSHINTHQTIPEKFSEKGYRTVGFSLNPWTASDTGFENIFDEFHELNPDSDSDIEVPPALPSGKIIDRVLGAMGREDILNWENRREWFSHWISFRDELFERIESLDEPYFIWIFLMDTHQPTIVPRRYRSESNILKTIYAINRFTSDRTNDLPRHVLDWLNESYRDAARSADEFISDLRGLLPEDDALVIHSDHGETLGEHEILGHEYRLYEENLRVPLVVSHPEVSGAASELVSLIQLPDLLEDLAEQKEISGKSYSQRFVPAMIESEETARVRSEMVGYTPHLRALRGERFKLIETKDEKLLFDLENDPDERTNVRKEYPELSSEFSRILDHRTAKREENWRVTKAVRAIDV